MELNETTLTHITLWYLVHSLWRYGRCKLRCNFDQIRTSAIFAANGNKLRLSRKKKNRLTEATPRSVITHSGRSMVFATAITTSLLQTNVGPVEEIIDHMFRRYQLVKFVHQINTEIRTWVDYITKSRKRNAPSVITRTPVAYCMRALPLYWGGGDRPLSRHVSHTFPQEVVRTDSSGIFSPLISTSYRNKIISCKMWTSAKSQRFRRSDIHCSQPFSSTLSRHCERWPFY